MIRVWLVVLMMSVAAAGESGGTFTNPLLPSGPDPWVIYRDGFYYYLHSTGRGLEIRKSPSLGKLAAAPDLTVWSAPNEGPYSHEIWAPELHYLQGAWYIYVAGDAGRNQTHRVWVLENRNPDPQSTNWIVKGKLADSSDKWAIDATVFEVEGQLFTAWSGWEGDTNAVQSIYLARMSNPWTIQGQRVRISTPEYPWEKVGDLKIGRNTEANPARDPEDPPHVDVNEGPAFLQHGDRYFLFYSASGCWTDFYSLGMITARAGSDLLAPSSWQKASQPVLWQSPSAHAFGTGHNSFFRSPDGTEDWILYHANPEAGQGCGGKRSPRAQRIRWTADGMPDLGRPVKLGEAITAPSGEK